VNAPDNLSALNGLADHNPSADGKIDRLYKA
jgi:hypothetical protein